MNSKVPCKENTANKMALVWFSGMVALSAAAAALYFCTTSQSINPGEARTLREAKDGLFIVRMHLSTLITLRTEGREAAEAKLRRNLAKDVAALKALVSQTAEYSLERLETRYMIKDAEEILLKETRKRQ